MIRSTSTAASTVRAPESTAPERPGRHSTPLSVRWRLATYVLPVAALLGLAGLATVLGRIPYPSAHYAFMDQNRYVAIVEKEHVPRMA